MRLIIILFNLILVDAALFSWMFKGYEESRNHEEEIQFRSTNTGRSRL